MRVIDSRDWPRRMQEHRSRHQRDPKQRWIGRFEQLERLRIDHSIGRALVAMRPEVEPRAVAEIRPDSHRMMDLQPRRKLCAPLAQIAFRGWMLDPELARKLRKVFSADERTYRLEGRGQGPARDGLRIGTIGPDT